MCISKDSLFLQKMNTDKSDKMIYYLTIGRNRISLTNQVFFLKLLWRIKLFCGFEIFQICEDVNFVQLQVFKSWKKLFDFQKPTTPKINIFF